MAVWTWTFWPFQLISVHICFWSERLFSYRIWLVLSNRSLRPNLPEARIALQVQMRQIRPPIFVLWKEKCTNLIHVLNLVLNSVDQFISFLQLLMEGLNYWKFWNFNWWRKKYLELLKGIFNRSNFRFFCSGRPIFCISRWVNKSDRAHRKRERPLKWWMA